MLRIGTSAARRSGSLWASTLLSAAIALVAAPSLADEDEDRETTRLNHLTLDRFLAGQARAMRVSDPIRIAAAPFCEDHLASVLGIYTAKKATFEHMIPTDLPFEKAFAADAATRFDLTRQPKVLLVVPGLPAERAGVAPGDVVTRVHGKKLTRYVQVDSLRPKDDAEHLQLTLERGGVPIEVSVESRLGCSTPSRFMFGTNVNAFATHFGRNTGIYVFGGMLEFMESDDDLAVIMGHELAHMILKHTQQMRATQKSEADADYLGLYLAARAGFDVSEAVDVWDRMARTNPYSTIDWGYYSHPMSPARSVMLRSTVAEIAAKRASGQDLMPERASR